MPDESQLLWVLLSLVTTPALVWLAIVLDRRYFTPYLNRLDREEDCHE